jgi:hypothetical protein
MTQQQVHPVETLIAELSKLPRTPEGNAQAEELIREYVVHERSKVRRPDSGPKEVLIDELRGIDVAPQHRLVSPQYPGVVPHERFAKCLLLKGKRILVADKETVKVGTVIWLNGPQLVISVEPVWDAPATHKYFLCEVEEGGSDS